MNDSLAETMPNDTIRRSRLGMKIVAGFMLAGGAAGLVGATPLLFKQQEFSGWLLVTLAALLHAGTASVGWGLWRGEAQYLTWARIIFGMQSVFFNIGGITFDFWNGISARVALDGWMVPMPPPSHSFTVGGSFGAAVNLNLTRQDSRWMFGINLIAVGILFWLLRARKAHPVPLPETPQPA
jgi:hypothetical protein